MSDIFGEKLKFLREKNGLKQKDLGNVLNYGSTTISNYESGRNEPSFADLCKIADYFDVSVDYLIGRYENNLCYEEKYKAFKKEDLQFWNIYKSLDDENQKTLRKLADFLKNDK